SLGFLGGLVQLDGSERFQNVAVRDTEFYLQDSSITSVSYFHVEALFWMFYATEDPALRAEVAAKLEEFLPTIFTGDPDDHLTYQGRAMIRWLSLLYYQRYFDDSPGIRAALLKGIWASASGSLPDSAKAVAERYPTTVYGPSIASMRYSAFAGIFLLELLDEGSSLLRDAPFP
ncbi:MAG TPA: hypothetical protein VK041_05070, partial [Opitutales bacterium]|nr:hypothetical protein [Opitutales bacterium]